MSHYEPTYLFGIKPKVLTEAELRAKIIQDKKDSKRFRKEAVERRDTKQFLSKVVNNEELHSWGKFPKEAKESITYILQDRLDTDIDYLNGVNADRVLDSKKNVVGIGVCVRTGVMYVANVHVPRDAKIAKLLEKTYANGIKKLQDAIYSKHEKALKYHGLEKRDITPDSVLQAYRDCDDGKYKFVTVYNAFQKLMEVDQKKETAVHQFSFQHEGLVSAGKCKSSVSLFIELETTKKKFEKKLSFTWTSLAELEANLTKATKTLSRDFF